jgi:hypothetical protein
MRYRIEVGAMATTDQCRIDPSRPCGACSASGPDQCPYTYLLADLFTYFDPGAHDLRDADSGDDDTGDDDTGDDEPALEPADAPEHEPT